MQLDATVCDANIKYPTVLPLLIQSHKKAEELIDKLDFVLKIKSPQTYRRVASNDYLNIAKKEKRQTVYS